MQNREIAQKIREQLTEPIRDPLWGHIYLSTGFKQLASTPAMIKLGSIRQLGPTWLVYPGATHTRLSHSLGVYELAKRIILKILSHERAPHLSIEGVNSFLSASLLHDTGHFPYAHSLKELPLKEHEAITAELVLTSPIKEVLNQKIGACAQMTAAIVDKEIPINSLNNKEEIILYRNLLSGVLDPDRLDYLNRDAFFCGIPYGRQDIDYVIDRIIPNGTKGIAVDQKGVEAVENILFSKYLMFKSVYWHKTTRIATAMIKKAILLGLFEEKIKQEALYHLDDYQFSQKFQRKDFAYHELVTMTDNRNFYQMILEESYDDKNKNLISLLNLEHRLKVELKLANQFKCRPQEIIIDIPEPITFESKLPIFKQGNYHSPKTGDFIFDDSVIKRFSHSLRKIRVFIHPTVSTAQIKSFNINSLML